MDASGSKSEKLVAERNLQDPSVQNDSDNEPDPICTECQVVIPWQ